LARVWWINEKTGPLKKCDMLIVQHESARELFYTMELNVSLGSNLTLQQSRMYDLVKLTLNFAIAHCLPNLLSSKMPNSH